MSKLARGMGAGVAIAVLALPLGGCSEDAVAKDPIVIGLIAPKTGALGVVGASFERVATAAQVAINAKGGVNGHPLVLVVLDDETNAELADNKLFELIDVYGAVAVVGPATSGAVGQATPVARARKVPIISPSSTAQTLASADDDGYMFRNVPNDGIQGLAMAYYLTQGADPAVTSVVVVHEDSPYGSGLADSFETAFTAAGGTTTATIPYGQNLADAAAADAVVAEMVLSAPSMVVLIALEQDGLKIVQQWDASGMLPGMRWFFTDGARSAGFLANLPASVVGSLGTAPTNPITGDAYGVLTARYNAANADDIGEQVFAANVWDAVYLIAAGLAQQEHDFPGEAFGGEHLRDAIVEVSRAPGQIQHAGQWRDLSAAVRSGGSVDYDGASGPCDFDENGEAVGPYEVWRIVDTGGTINFEQVIFLEARDIAALSDP